MFFEISMLNLPCFEPTVVVSWSVPAMEEPGISRKRNDGMRNKIINKFSWNIFFKLFLLDCSIIPFFNSVRYFLSKCSFNFQPNHFSELLYLLPSYSCLQIWDHHQFAESSFGESIAWLKVKWNQWTLTRRSWRIICP